jgi:hypothetical protein
VFRTVTEAKTVFIGRLGMEEENQSLLKTLAKRPGTNVAVFPVVVKGRVVNLIYGDQGAAGNVKAELGELMVFIQKVPRAYLRIIRKRIAETQKTSPAEPGAENKENE